MSTDVQGGREGALLGMGKSHASYSWKTKLAAAGAVVDRGQPKPEVMAELGVASLTPLKALCRACWEGGAEALRPRSKGRLRLRRASRSSRSGFACSRPRCEVCQDFGRYAAR